MFFLLFCFIHNNLIRKSLLNNCNLKKDYKIEIIICYKPKPIIRIDIF